MQLPAPFVVLARHLPMAVLYDPATLDLRCLRMLGARAWAGSAAGMRRSAPRGRVACAGRDVGARRGRCARWSCLLRGCVSRACVGFDGAVRLTLWLLPPKRQ